MLGLALLFLLSGLSALIYQSVWSHYLGLVLGHAAYAQTLVLVMFMGGMALGAWAVSRVSGGWRRLIGAYALAELLIGLAGLLFHPLFQAYVGWSQGTVLPRLEGGVAAMAWQWGSAALLIAPQTVLLGATFPLIAAGALRLRRAPDGELLGGLYFSNSLGAAIGVLLATFFLLPRLGMPGAMAVAGGINLFLAAATAWMSWRLRERELPLPSPAASDDGDAAADTRLRRVLLASTFLSSAASFAYEIGWVRLLQQALGTTLHAFELMLAAFIGGMALGGWWVRRRSASIRDVVAYAGAVQVLMGLCALISIPVLAGSYEWVAWLLKALARSNEGYLLYSLATAVIAILVMVPAAFFAGMTLPLFTTALLRRGQGERVIGQVYAANTVGAILGVTLTVHLLVPVLGLSLALVLAALADVLIGLWLLRRISPGRWTPRVAGGALLALGVCVLVVRLGMPDPLAQAAGVFRSGVTKLPDRELLYFKDGETSTISVMRSPQTISIATNGKPDAGVAPPGAGATADEVTMRMLGLLPLALHPAPQRVALIGWGSGISTHTVLGSPEPQVVDTIEIEPAMWEGAKIFNYANQRAYEDPRSAVRFEDARQFFSRAGKPYDVIVSEPSNPWVSGVASLFTREFYALTRRHLSEGGLLVQWLHTYEMSDALLSEMVAALLAEYPNAELYASNAADLLIVARKGASGPIRDTPWKSATLAAELSRSALGHPDDVQIRYLGDARLLRSFVARHAGRVHSDFHPTVALSAPQQRFAGRQANELMKFAASPLPLMRVLACREPMSPQARITAAFSAPRVGQHVEAVASLQAWRATSASQAGGPKSPLDRALESLQARLNGKLPWDAEHTREDLAQLALATLAALPAAERAEIWTDPRWQRSQAAMPAAVRTAFALWQSAALDDWAATAQAARAALQANTLPESQRETGMVLGMLADLARGEKNAVTQWEKEFGRGDRDERWKGERGLLRQWAAHESICVAKR